MKGQALVEMAIITPVLIFLLIGVLEIGWMLRGYLILTNANREAARFAVRQNYLDFNSDDIGYEKVWTHTLESISGQIPFDENHGTMLISYIHIVATCTQTLAISTPLNVPTYTWKYPITSPETTNLNYIEISDRALQDQIRHACDEEYFNFIPSNSDMVTVEMWYRHSQLFGFPLISNPLTDPVPMYANTTFRKAPDSRFINHE